MFLDDKTEQALRNILGFLEDSERQDYDSRPEAERVNHVYHSVRIVRDWLAGEEHEVIYRDGKREHVGYYRVDEGIVTVRCEFGTKSTQVGGSPPESIARLLLRELVGGGQLGGSAP